MWGLRRRAQRHQNGLCTTIDSNFIPIVILWKLRNLREREPPAEKSNVTLDKYHERMRSFREVPFVYGGYEGFLPKKLLTQLSSKCTL